MVGSKFPFIFTVGLLYRGSLQKGSTLRTTPGFKPKLIEFGDFLNDYIYHCYILRFLYILSPNITNLTSIGLSRDMNIN